jgi:outer membrane cobalamin receptor
MFLRQFLTVILLLFCLTIFSQQKGNITGKITSDKIAIVDRIIELQINKSSKFAVSDKDGIYRFNNITILTADSIYIKINFSGYETYIKKIENLKLNTIYDINLIKLETKSLDEVVIKTENKIVNKANKSIYKINSKAFIKNTKAGEVLKTIPNVYILNDDVVVDGKLSAKLFIDGIEMMSGELNTITAADIDRVEVNSNPSSAYGADIMGAIINIITKENTEEFVKGAIASATGTRNDYSGVSPSLSYKKGRFIVKSAFDYKTSNQKINYSLTRQENNSIFSQNNINNSKGTQLFSQTRVNIKFSEKSELNFSGLLSSYKFTSDAKGFSSVNNINPSPFYKNGLQSNTSWNVSSVYKYKINDTEFLFIKSKYYEYDDINNFAINDNNTIAAIFNIQSKNKEFSGVIDYKAEKLTVFKNKAHFYSGLKYINRNFSFSNTTFYINQSIINGYIELDTDWSEKFSSNINFAIENTRNYNKSLNQNYLILLPTLNAIYHFENKYDAKFGYSRKIIRPDANELNTDLLLNYPGLGKRGNSNLNPQKRDYYYFTINKASNSNNFSLKVYNESINNAIVETYKSQGNLVIQTPENAAKYNSTGINFGLRTKLFKKIDINLNSGFDYNVFEDNSSLALVKENSGYTFRGNINLGTKLFKNKVSVSLSGMQNGPEYSLLSKSINNPYLDFTITTNFFKDKINVSLYGRDLLQINANRKELSSYNNFYQRIDIKNDFYNFILTLTYNFGKKFNDKIEDNNIENNDVRR